MQLRLIEKHTADTFTKSKSMSTEESKSVSFLLFALTIHGTSKWDMTPNEQDRLIYGVKRGEWKDIISTMFDDLSYNNDEFDDTLDINEEIEILGEAYENAYKILTGKVQVEEFLLEKTDAGDIVFLPFDPKEPETIELIIDDVIAYFEEGEEYEKCSELLEIKKKFDDTK